MLRNMVREILLKFKDEFVYLEFYSFVGMMLDLDEDYYACHL